MSNPFFSRSTAFKEGGHAPGTAPAQTPNGYPTMPGYQAGQYGQQASGYGQQATGYGQQYGQYGNQYGQQVAGYGQVTPEQMAGLETQYQAPSATNADMRRMTYDDVIIRTAGMFAVILAMGALTWSLVTNEATFGMGAAAVLAGVIGSIVLGLVNSFKREPSPALILAYAAFEGLMLGGVSGVMEARYEGIVVQAVLATLATFGAMLLRRLPGPGQVLSSGGRGHLRLHDLQPHQLRPHGDRRHHRRLGPALPDHHGDSAGSPAGNSCGHPGLLLPGDRLRVH